MKERTKGLKFKTWFLFTSFATAILLLLWILQRSLITPYYQTAKVNSIKELASRIENMVVYNTNVTDLATMASDNGVCIQVVNNNGYSNLYNGVGDACYYEVVSRQPDKTLSYSELIDQINESESKDAEVFVEYNGDNIAVYARRVDLQLGGFYLIINGYVTPEKAGFTLIQNQFFILAIIVVIMATIASLYLSKKISKPITKMTDSAKELGKGNFDVSFEVSSGGYSYSELNELSRTLDYATDEMSKTDELRRDLIANVSHDIKTPLTMILAYTEMIQDFSRNNPEKLTEHLKVIEDEAKYMQNLIEDMLELSKVESGVIDLKMEAIDFNVLMQDIINHYRSSHPDFTFNFYQDADAQFVEADRIKISQVIYNFLTNAIKFSENSKVIDARTYEDDDYLYVSIKDYGVGIDENNLESVWDRYFQINKNHSRNEGSGLGLAIAKGLIKAHDGIYGINSTVGQGSEFYFGIPKKTNEKI